MFLQSSYDYFNIDSTPLDESCAQVGSTTTHILLLEARTFRDQLERQFSPFPEGFSIQVNPNSHEFGSYYDLKLCYLDEDEESPSLQKALEIEGDVPTKWDNQSLDVLTDKANNPTKIACLILHYSHIHIQNSGSSAAIRLGQLASAAAGS